MAKKRASIAKLKSTQSGPRRPSPTEAIAHLAARVKTRGDTPGTWQCASCGNENFAARATCAGCHEPRPDPTRPRQHFCPFDGALLQDNGFCPDGNGYPHLLTYPFDRSFATLEERRALGGPSPFACPTCRKFLEWHGGCYVCFGRETADAPRTFPGDRYDRFDDTGNPIGDGQHWVLTQRREVPEVVPNERDFVAALRRSQGG